MRPFFPPDRIHIDNKYAEIVLPYQDRIRFVAEFWSIGISSFFFKRRNGQNQISMGFIEILGLYFKLVRLHSIHEEKSATRCSSWPSERVKTKIRREKSNLLMNSIFSIQWGSKIVHRELSCLVPSRGENEIDELNSVKVRSTFDTGILGTKAFNRNSTNELIRSIDLSGSFFTDTSDRKSVRFPSMFSFCESKPVCSNGSSTTQKPNFHPRLFSSQWFSEILSIRKNHQEIYRICFSNRMIFFNWWN